MYKILFMISLFIFHPAWSYISEKGPGQGDVFVGSVSELDWPGDIGPVSATDWPGDIGPVSATDWPGDIGPVSATDWPVHVAQAPTVIIKLAMKGPEQSEWFIQSVEGPGQMPWPGEVVEGPEQSEWFVEPVGEEEGPTFMIQFADGRPSGPMGVAPTVLIQFTDGPGQLSVPEMNPAADESEPMEVAYNTKRAAQLVEKIVRAWHKGDKKTVDLYLSPIAAERLARRRK